VPFYYSKRFIERDDLHSQTQAKVLQPHVEMKLEEKSQPKLFCAQSKWQKGTQKKFLLGKNRSREEGKIFALRTTFPSHSVSRFAAKSFYEREFFYSIKVEKLKVSHFKVDERV
jgi:hypothetical protein